MEARVGSFATGYEQIKQKVWFCPRHGEVTAWRIASSYDGSQWHIGCDQRVKRRERLASAPPLKGYES